mgnify:FL=1
MVGLALNHLKKLIKERSAVHERFYLKSQLGEVEMKQIDKKIESHLARSWLKYLARSFINIKKGIIWSTIT